MMSDVEFICICYLYMAVMLRSIDVTIQKHAFHITSNVLLVSYSSYYDNTDCHMDSQLA